MHDGILSNWNHGKKFFSEKNEKASDKSQDFHWQSYTDIAIPKCCQVHQDNHVRHLIAPELSQLTRSIPTNKTKLLLV